MARSIDNDIYNRMADTWWNGEGFLNSLHALNPGRFAYLEKLLAEQGVEPQGAKVIDIGCGGGYASERMARMGMQVIGVDPSEASLDAARNHAAGEKLAIDYRWGSGESLPVDSGSMDLAFCCDVLEHVDDVQQTLIEIHRVLKPNGIFFFDTINRTPFSWLFLIKFAQDLPLTRILPRDTHVWNKFIKPLELNAWLVQAGFTPKEVTGFAPKLTPGNVANALRARFGSQDPEAIGAALDMGPSKFKGGLYMGWARKEYD